MAVDWSKWSLGSSQQNAQPQGQPAQQGQQDWSTWSLGQGAPQGGQQAAPSQGWSLNPLDDVQHGLSSIGGWLNDHTHIGNFNPGIGSAVQTIGGVIPGLVNLGIAAATPWNKQSQQRLQGAGQGLVHGVEDTATDIATAGGLAPYTNQFENAVSNLPGSYHPNTLKQYATQKGGPGLLGGALNDVANVAIGAGAAAKVASLGELGEAGVAAQAADRAAQLAKAAQGGLPGDVAEAGRVARTGLAEAHPLDTMSILQRAKLLDRLDVARQGADVAFNPLRAYQSLVAPLGRAAVLKAIPEAGLTTEASRVAEAVPEVAGVTGHPEPAPIAPEATQGVSGHVTPEPVPVGAPAPNPLQAAMQEAVAAQEAKAARPFASPYETGAAADMAREEALKGVEKPVTLYRGQPLDPNQPVGIDNWTTTKAEAESHARASGGQVIETQVPPEVAKAAHEAAVAAGDRGGFDTVHHIPQQWADLAQPMLAEPNVPAGAGAPGGAPGVAGTPAPAPLPPKWVEEIKQRNRDMGPREAQANLSRAKGVPDWANKVVGHLPEFARKQLRNMEYANQRHTLSNVIQEGQRSLRMSAAREMREPWFKAHVDLAHSLIGTEDGAGKLISPDMADRMVGERVRAAMSAGPVWQQMEALRPMLDAIEPHAVEKALGFEGIAPALNTPEFQAQIQHIADLASAHLEGRSQFAATSPYLGDRGLGDINGSTPTLTAEQQAMSKKAVKAKLDAMNLEPVARAQAEAAAEQIAAHEMAAAGASADMTTARAAAADALNRITEGRQGAPIKEGEPGPNGEPGVITGAEPAPGNLTAKQLVSSAPGRPDLTPKEAYQRGLDMAKARDDYEAAQAAEREAYGRVLQAHQSVVELQQTLANSTLPAQMSAAALHGRSAELLARLQDEMNNASVSRVPPVYQPALRAALQIAGMVKEHPELADVLADVPKSFGEVVQSFHDLGFDPTHVSEMTEEQARRFAMGTASLSRNLGKQEIGLFRKGRTGALATAGLDSRTAAGMAAQWASVLHEERVNAIADTVDRLYAIPGEKNHLGQTINPNPKEYVAWDPQRRGLMATEKPSSGEQQAVQARYFIPRSVSRVIDAYSKDHTNFLQRALAKTTNPWRALVLTASPKFYVNHMIGHIVLGAVQGVSLPQWVAAWKEAKSGFANLPELTKSGITQGDIGNSGMVGYGTLGKAREGGGWMGALHEGQQKLSNAVNAVDAFAKAALQIHGVAKGLSRDEALHFAQIAGVDYSALTPFEAQVVRAVIPFYSFEKGVLKIVMQYPLDHPAAANTLMQIGRLQQAMSVDAQGNPLPAAYQSIIDVPGLGHLNVKSLTPFKDVGSLLTATGLVNSLQFVVKTGIQSGLGIANPGQKVGTKIGPTGALIPDVPIVPTLAASLQATPQGALLSNPTGQGALSFLGAPTVKESTLSAAGARNVLSQGEHQLPLADQQKATAFPVDTNLLQNKLATQLKGDTPLNLTSATTPEVQQALADAVAKQQAAAAATRAARTPEQIAAEKQQARETRQANRAAGKFPRRGGGGRRSSGGSSHKAGGSGTRRVSSRARTVSSRKSGGSFKMPRATKLKLVQGFGKSTNAARSGGSGRPVFKTGVKGVAGVKKFG